MIEEKKLKQELSSLPEGWIILLETKAENAMELGIAAVKILTADGYYGIILSASRPCTNLISIYQKNKINTAELLILCACCQGTAMQKSGKAPEASKESSRIMHLEGISALTQMAMALNDSMKMKNAKGKKFIFIDSITSMLIHNNAISFARFTHSILTKMRINGVSGLLISIENETNKEVRAETAQLCDKVIRL